MFKLNIDLKKDRTADVFNISEDRVDELNKIIGHALIDHKTGLGVIAEVALHCDTIEELVMCAYAVGKV